MQNVIRTRLLTIAFYIKNRRKMKLQTIVLLLALAILQACNSGTNTDHATEMANHTDVELNTPEEVKTEKAATPDAFDATFTDGMTATVYQYYLKLQMALVNSDADDAKSAASNLAEALGDDKPALHDLAQEVAAAEDLDRCSIHFCSADNRPGATFYRWHYGRRHLQTALSDGLRRCGRRLVLRCV